MIKKNIVYIFAALIYHASCRLYVRPPYFIRPPTRPPPRTTAQPLLKSQASPVDYMVCKPISGVFGLSTTGKDRSSMTLRGPEGMPGPEGKSGVRGAKGKADYEEAERIIEESLGDMKDKIYALELEVERFPVAYGTPVTPQKPTKSPDQVANEKRCKEKFQSPIAIGTMCYNILGDGVGLLWSQPIAQTQCEKLGGNLADMETKEVYNAIYTLADQRYATDIRAWTGMRFENKKLMTRNNDTEISYAKWTAGYPRKSSSYSRYYDDFTRVYIAIDTSAHVRRLLNGRPSYTQAYAICSYDLEQSNSTVLTTTAASIERNTL